jgi:Ca-activated chloride channel family protein
MRTVSYLALLLILALQMLLVSCTQRSQESQTTGAVTPTATATDGNLPPAPGKPTVAGPPSGRLKARDVTFSKSSSRKIMQESFSGPRGQANIPGYPMVETEKKADTSRYIEKDETGAESYDAIVENPFMRAKDNPISTFSIDVDTASYSNMRRFLTTGSLPPPDSVRIEELVNYFTYDYPQPKGEDPFSINIEAGECPWNKAHKLVLVGLQGKKFSAEKLPPSNLVFLIDVSGSMSDQNKLPLLKEAFKLLAQQLTPRDKVTIVVYAGAAGVVLPTTPGNEKDRILQALDGLEAGGSTAGAQGIVLAYEEAQKSFIQDGNNRVILATDGDFNVGVSSDADLVKLIEEKRKKGVYLSVLGFGMGNLKDSKMEKLADKGNGNYAYIDNLTEAKKVLVTQMGGTLHTIAKDVKLQLLFNPEKVKGYRLLGYENRVLATRDFSDDTKDAGELGAGHCVTALYEIIPASSNEEIPAPPANVQKEKEKIDPFKPGELMVVKLRYKKPSWNTSTLIVKSIGDAAQAPSANLRFASSVVELGLILRGSKHKGQAGYDDVVKLASESKGADLDGYREEFIKLAETAKKLDSRGQSTRGK